MKRKHDPLHGSQSIQTVHPLEATGEPMDSQNAMNDSDLDGLVAGRKLTEVEKWSLRIIYASGVGAAAFSASAEGTMKGGAAMLSEAIFNDGDISPIFSFKFFGHK